MAVKFANPRDKLILIADDDAGIRQLLEMAFQEDGFRVETAGDGPKTIDKIRRNSPDIVILDLMMPGYGGFEILRKLRDSAAAETPVVLLTARFMDESTQQMIRTEANVKEFIFKPVSIPLIRSLVSRLLKTPPPSTGTRPA